MEHSHIVPAFLHGVAFAVQSDIFTLFWYAWKIFFPDIHGREIPENPVIISAAYSRFWTGLACAHYHQKFHAVQIMNFPEFFRVEEYVFNVGRYLIPETHDVSPLAAGTIAAGQSLTCTVVAAAALSATAIPAGTPVAVLSMFLFVAFQKTASPVEMARLEAAGIS